MMNILDEGEIESRSQPNADENLPAANLAARPRSASPFGSVPDQSRLPRGPEFRQEAPGASTHEAAMDSIRKSSVARHRAARRCGTWAILVLAVAGLISVSSTAQAQMSEQILGDLEYMARQIATCYAAGQMDFGQRVLQRRFIDDYLNRCAATSKQKSRIDHDLLYSPDRPEACDMRHFFEVKDGLTTLRSRRVC
jgi:hypothetical protein